MFKFLKEKLNNVVKKFSKEVEEEAELIDDLEEKTELIEKKPVKNEQVENKKQTTKEIPNKQEPEKKELKEEPKKEEHKEEKKETTKHDKKEIIHDNKKYDYDELKQDIVIEEKHEEEVKESAHEEKEKKGFFSKLFHKKVKKQDTQDVVEEKKIENKKDELEEELKEKKPEEKKGFFEKVSDTFTKIQLTEQKFEELFWDIEITLLENNVAIEVIELIKQDLKEELTTGKISRKNVEEIILDTLKESLDKVLSVQKIDLEKEIKNKKPYIIAVIGVNGSGKTTAIAKLTNLLQKQGHTVVIAAADTFRAAAIQQIEEHAKKLGTKLIKHDYNSDPAAVAFDAVKHAQSKGIDVVLIDTAGRMHSNDNLMQELKKLIRVNNPDMKLFVGESITGNDCIEQAKKYNEEIGIDAIILTKADVDEKGGAAISISHVTGKPILFIGTGQTYDDLEAFNKKKILANIGL